MFGILKQIWTIASHSILQAIRMRLVIVLAAFLLVLVPALPFLLESDRTLAGQLRMILTYTTYLIGFLLSVLTLFLSAITLNTEIKHQHIFMIDPKPISRTTVLAGKWLGVMVIVTALLAAMMGVSYGLLRYHARPAPNAPPEAFALVQAEVLTARRIVRPPLPDLSGLVAQEIEQLKAQGLMPTDRSEEWVRQRLAQRFSRSAWQVPPNTTVEWVIPNVPKRAGATLLVRFRHLGDSGKHDHEILGRFDVNETGDFRSFIERPFRVNSPHSFGVSSQVVRDDGTVVVRYTNKDTSDVSAIFPFDDGVQVMYPVTSIGWNYVRAGGIILIKLAFIAILGIFASTFMSFPVAVLFSLVVFMVGHMANFVVADLLQDLYIFGSGLVPPGTPMNPGDEFVRTVLYHFFNLFPNFSRYDVVPALTEGGVIEYRHIFGVFVELIVLRGAVLGVAGWYIFRRRELAALTPTT